MQVPLDPQTYGAATWGVLGALVFVIVVLGLIIYKLYAAGFAQAQARESSLMAFVTGHTEKTAGALTTLGNAIQVGDERVAQALESQTRMLQSVLITWEALSRARAAKSSGAALTPGEIEGIVRSSHDAVQRNHR